MFCVVTDPRRLSGSADYLVRILASLARARPYMQLYVRVCALIFPCHGSNHSTDGRQRSLRSYSACFATAPVFSLVLDRDVNENIAMMYSEPYEELRKGQLFSFKTFFS